MNGPFDSLEGALAAIPDPKAGLPDPVFDFVRRVTPLINVDLLIQSEGRTLLAWRRDAYGTGWHIPGGIVRFFEPLARRIGEVARLELGAAVSAEDTAATITQFFNGRGHFISLMFRTRLVTPIPAERLWDGGQPADGALAWISGVPADLYPAHEVYRGWLAGDADGQGRRRPPRGLVTGDS